MTIIIRQLGVAILLFCALFCKAQTGGTITGRLIDKYTKRPVPGAAVSIMPGDTIGVTSDSTGYFALKSVTSGIYSLKVTSWGYEGLWLNDVKVYEAKTTNREIELQESQYQLKSVSVRAFRNENNRMMPVSAYSFSREEIALNPGAQGDIFRAIGMLPGVSSSGGVYSAIAVRGQGVRDNVYMVDDIPVTEVGHLEGNSFFNDPNGGRFSIFAPRVIDNAVFQGGGFGAEYGRRSASYLGLSVKEGGGNAVIDGQIDLLGLTLNYDGPSGLHKNTSLFASARYQNFYGLVNLIGLKDIGLPIYGDLIVKTTTEFSKQNKLSLIAIVSPERYVRDVDNVYADKKKNLLYLPDFVRNKVIAGLNLRTLTGKKSYWRNVLYYTNYTSDIKVGKAYPVSDTEGNLTDPDISFKTMLQTQEYTESKVGLRSLFEVSLPRKQKLVLGAEADVLHLYNNRALIGNDTIFSYRANNSLNRQMYQVVTPELVNARFKDGSYNASVYINYSSMPAKWASVNVGLRADYTGFCKQLVVAPRISGSFFLNEQNTINYGFGLYYQDPVYSDIADQVTGIRLKMEQVQQYIVGYRRYFSSHLKLTAEMWYKNFDKLVVNPISGTSLKTNRGTGYGRGIDLNLTKRLVSNLHGQLGYSFMDCQRDDHDGLGLYDFIYSQPHQINALISYKVNTRLSLAVKYRYATGRPTDRYVVHRNVLNNNVLRFSQELMGRNEDRLPDFSSLDIRANYSFKWRSCHFTAFIDVVNVLNRQIANGASFNAISGKVYYDGLAIFPSGGLKFEF